MSPLTKFDETFLIETEKQKLQIIALVSSRIEKANEDESWISSKLISYKGITVANDEITILRQPALINPWHGLGKISLRLTSKQNVTLIQVEVRPFHWIYKYNSVSLLFILISITLIMLLVDRSKLAIFIVVSAWIVFPTLLYLIITISRNQLKKYLKNFLEDLGIKEKLQLTRTV